MDDADPELEGSTDHPNWPVIIEGGTGKESFVPQPNWPQFIQGPELGAVRTWKGPAAPIVFGLEQPGGLQGWTDTIKDLWTGSAASADDGTAYPWWDRHGGKVKIGAALAAGALAGMFVWKMVR